MKSIFCDGRFGNLPVWLPRWCMALGLFLLIYGAKLWLIDRFGNATPSFDEWATEASIIKSYVEGTFTPAQLFKTHNEHHMAYSQMMTLFLFWANKQWDPILHMVAQALVHATAVVAFVTLAGTWMSSLGRAALAGFAAGVTILPFGWENTLWGDQSCFYFSMLFGIATIWFCWRYEPLTPRWWLGAILAFAGLYTMASGTFCVMALAAFLALRVIVERGKEWKRQLAGAAILAAIAIFGVADTPNLSQPGAVVATTFHAFLLALTGLLSWPCSSHFAWVIVQAPLILLTLLNLLDRVSFRDGRWFVIIAGADFWIQALATSYRRGNGWYASRYCDSWSLLLIIICSCLYFLGRTLGERRRFLIYPLAAVWFSACLYGMLDRAINLLPRQLATFRSILFEEENNVREYLIAGKPLPVHGRIPYLHPDLLEHILDSPTIRSVLPSNLISANHPLTPLRQKPGGTGFVPNGYSSNTPRLDKPTFGSYGKGETQTKSGITLLFKVPRGTRQIDLQVAGFPNADGIAFRLEEHHKASYSIAPPLDPGNNWQSISVKLDPRLTYFKISAKDRTNGDWIAFSMPTIINGHAPGRWARSLIDNSIYFLVPGLVLLIVGGLAAISIGDPPSDAVSIENARC